MAGVDVEKALQENGIKVRSLKMGTQYAICPNCSHKRKGAHKKLKCLSVKIDASGVVWNCHHCTWSSYENAKREARQRDRGQRPHQRNGGGYGDLQRASLARFAGQPRRSAG
ncbi:hypothetical protein BDS110ZK4_28280 [Bradyrhizobium diazoefficiens]|uniref:Transposase n=1 Tax=Bradyrhizobium diazoefficiens TaxID=1355477 RepID=A0A809X522_9BRAD|nr:hypothetical protein XF1B_47660 [Bradyrhizobium diazoefficiens]BCE48350.1 hypothetical protein XF4B_46990 [Bradyrhizobium diazoefficiens]BCE91866.1 hypothetical protein XF10B_46640 [Bradyrhizobium diazoefficiens]BCF26794.1 hypothetical protein XF14B_47460 [Bradyrhizobium diazoefficiens]